MNKKKILALVVTILLLVLIFYKIDVKELITTFKEFNFKNIWLIVPLYISTLYLRGIRWKALLLNNPKYSSLHLGEVFTVGSMLNVFLPARAGDVYRAYYLGAVKNEKKMKVFGSIILERTLDGICVFGILLSAILIYFRHDWILRLAYGIGALFVGSLIVFYIVFKFNKISWICEKLVIAAEKLPEKIVQPSRNFIEKICAHTNSFMEGFEVLDNFGCTFAAVFTSIVIWIIEAYVAYLIVDSFGLGLGFAAGLFVISLISFSTMLPSTSVFLGPYQVAYIMALGIFGIEKSTALAISTVHQMILAVMLTVIGGYCLLKFNISMKDINANQKIEG